MNIFLQKAQEKLSLTRKYFYPCFLIKPLFGVFFFLLLLSATVGTANAQMEPKFEVNKKDGRELARPKNQLIPLDSLYYYYRPLMKYKGIYPSHSGIDVSKVKVIGTKFCDVEVDRDWIVFRDYIRRDGLVYDVLFHMVEASNETARKIWNPHAIKQMIYSSPREGKYEMVAFVYEYGILGITLNRNERILTMIHSTAKPQDGSKLFLDRVLLASTGDVIATTPTTYMIVGPDGKVIESYKELTRADVPDIKNPTIREVKPGLVYINDEVMGKYRIEIYLPPNFPKLTVGVEEGD
jgi:hypothetical protein